MYIRQLKFNFLHLIFGLKSTVLFVSGYYFMIFIIFNDRSIFKLWYVHLWPILTSIPDLVIIAGYIVEDFNKKITIGNHFITDDRTGKKYRAEEIRKIVIHKPDSAYYKTLSFLYYQFAEIILKNGDRMIITSLMKSNIDEVIKENLKGVYFDRDNNNFL